MNSNGKITAPVSLHADVYPVLGLTKTGTYYDTGWVCSNSHGKINKWSKRKPIRYAQPGELTDAQFKGTYADNNQGIYYGMKVASEAGRLGQLHTASWEYLPPRPGTDWCRLTDFVGYDHNAKPFLSAGFGNGEKIEVNRYLKPKKTFTFTRNTSASSIQPSDFANSIINTIGKGRIAAIIFPGTTLQPYPGMGNPLSLQTGDYITDAEPSIEVDFTDVRLGGTSVVFAIAFEAANLSYMPLPGAGNGNLGYWVSADVTETANEATFMLDMMGFRNNYVNTPLTPMQYLIDTSNPNYAPLKVYERGIVSFQITILASQETYTIYSADQFRAFVDIGGDLYGIADTYLRVKSINGSTSISYPYTTSRTRNTTIVLENNSTADPAFPESLKDGAYTVRIKDSRLGIYAPDLCRRDNVHLDNMG